MTVDVSEPPQPFIDVDGIARFAAATLEREGVEPEAHLSIAFVDTDQISELNAEHMGRQGPTDVLSFPIEDAHPGQPPRGTPGGPPLLLGDVFISADVVAAQAEENGVSFEDELYLIVCHGVLHILGWDHQTEEEANQMESREAEHLATVGRKRR